MADKPAGAVAGLPAVPMAGFTLIEVLVAIVILVFGLLAVGSMQIAAIRGNFMGGNTSIALSLAGEKMEDLLNKDFTHADLNDGVTGNNGTLSSTTSVDHQENPFRRRGGRRLRVLPKDLEHCRSGFADHQERDGHRDMGKQQAPCLHSVDQKTVRSQEDFMHSVVIRLKSEEGNVTIIAFVLLVVLTLIGIFATKTAQIDMQTAYNEVPYKQNFYVAEGGVNREAAELGRGMYTVPNSTAPKCWPPIRAVACPGLRTKCSATLMSSPSDTWASSPLLAGTRPFISAATITMWTPGPAGPQSSGQVRVASRLYKIGPRAE